MVDSCGVMSEVVLDEVDSADEFQADSLRVRASTSPCSRHTHWYRARCGPSEVAFVSVDIGPERDFLVLYEIFVDPQQRRLRFGTRILALVEQLARWFERRRITLCPRPLDSTIAKIDLEAWYARLGYKPRDEVPDELEKFLA
jgi:GNAT superfamily N-acetyltransferase